VDSKPFDAKRTSRTYPIIFRLFLDVVRVERIWDLSISAMCRSAGLASRAER
jgi:hypothetical protein